MELVGLFDKLSQKLGKLRTDAGQSDKIHSGLGALLSVIGVLTSVCHAV
jgi:hypothetical protein